MMLYLNNYIRFFKKIMKFIPLNKYPYLACVYNPIHAYIYAYAHMYQTEKKSHKTKTRKNGSLCISTSRRNHVELPLSLINVHYTLLHKQVVDHLDKYFQQARLLRGYVGLRATNSNSLVNKAINKKAQPQAGLRGKNHPRKVTGVSQVSCLTMLWG